MRDLNTRKKSKNILQRHFLLSVVFIIFSLLLFFTSYKLYIRKKKAERELSQLEERLREIKEKRNNLERDLKQIKSEEGREEFLKKYYGLRNETERIIYIMDER